MFNAWHEKAWKDYLDWEEKDRKKWKRINALIADIARNGYMGIGNPEPLKHELSGWWSRQIDEKNRLVYRIRDDHIEIMQCGGHYRDK